MIWERTRQLNRRLNNKSRDFSEEEKKQQQLRCLFSALSSGNLKSVTEILDSGLSVNVNVQDNWTPLLLTASFGCPELTEELIRRGADVNIRRDGCTALMMACNCPQKYLAI
ncbi:hypothetical protein NQ318_015379 [Aromia moschata]|uniref:Uncharacterized protein n=1 Tax=Aromia moschata TaxID=1265417 RepID=A0AAV8YQG7_9CUCU|nr:hypothetical protein NQ318_015379 [Aromia moschata]